MTPWHRLLATTLLVLPSLSHADVQINGFLNIVGGYATERKNDRYEQEQLLFEPDSSLGLQISRELSSKTSVTGQLIARGSRDFEVEASWAYVTHHISESSYFRAGRFRTPFFLYSDYLDVGYAQHWLTPPDEVYALQFDNINGIDFNHQLPIGPLDAKLQLYAGSANNRFVNENTGDELQLEMRGQFGIVGTLAYQWLTLRASFHQVSDLTMTNFSDVSLPSPLNNVAGLRQTLENFGNTGQYLLNQLDVTGVAAEFSEAAIKMEWAHFFAIAEGTLLTFDHGPLGEQRRHFISVGTRFKDMTLYTSYSRANDKQVNLHEHLPSTPATAGIRRVLDGLTSSLMLLSEGSSLGLRYDYDPGVAFKIELSESQVPNAVDSYMLRLGYNLVF